MCWKYRTQKWRKNRHLDTIPQLCRAISSQLRHISTIGKNSLSSNISCTSPHNMVNFGLLAAQMVSLVWGTPANFNGFRVLAASLHGSQVVSVSQTLRRWTEGATYVRQDDHHVGYWPTFSFLSFIGKLYYTVASKHGSINGNWYEMQTLILWRKIKQEKKKKERTGIINHKHMNTASNHKHSLTFHVRSYAVTATKPIHRLQIHQTAHNYRARPIIPPTYIRVRAVVWECGEGQRDIHTDRYTDGRDQYTFRRGYASREM